MTITASPTLRQVVMAVCEKRGWATTWVDRSSYLFLEAAELTEAIRGKGGDTLEESADVLFTFLALTPHELEEIIPVLIKKCHDLMFKGRYPGEEFVE